MRQIPGIYLNAEEATKLYVAAVAVGELRDLVQLGGIESAADNMLEILANQLEEVIDGSQFNYYDTDGGLPDCKQAIEHLLYQKRKLDNNLKRLNQDVAEADKELNKKK